MTRTYKTTLITALLIAISFALAACGKNYSNGSRVGVINKFSYKGLMIKSWEGEMVLGGFSSTTSGDGGVSVMANIFKFNVQSPEVAEKVKEAMRKGARVELFYNQWFVPPLSQESGYTITDVKPAQ